jgi:hypothetical protein
VVGLIPPAAATLTGCDSVYDVLVTPDGSTAVTTCRTAVKLWSLPDWGAQATLGSFDTILIDVALDKAGKTLAAVSRAGLRCGSSRQTPALLVRDGARRGRFQLARCPDSRRDRAGDGGLGQPTEVWTVPGANAWPRWKRAIATT